MTEETKQVVDATAVALDFDQTRYNERLDFLELDATGRQILKDFLSRSG